MSRFVDRSKELLAGSGAASIGISKQPLYKVAAVRVVKLPTEEG